MEEPLRPEVVVEPDGTVRVPSFLLPLSSVASPEARNGMRATLGRSPIDLPSLAGLDDDAYVEYIERFRRELDDSLLAPLAETLKRAFPVDIEPGVIAGVPVEVITPVDGADGERILINLHGGGWIAGSVHNGRVESIPVAHRSGFRVVAVDYRQAYEHTYPAATEDVVAVYQELLNTHSPSHIGIFGGSAGAHLAAQATAWLLDHDLPAPAALFMGGNGAGGPSGDSRFFSAVGSAKVPPTPAEAELLITDPERRGYFRTAAPGDYLAEPVLAPLALLARFPPTLFITATRAFDLSPAINFHRALTRAGVDASLHVFDGLGHCFYYNAWLPESVDALETIVHFLRRHLQGPLTT